MRLAACGRIARPQADLTTWFDLHHMTARLSGERLRSQSEPERTGDSRTERLKLLLELLHLLRDDDLNQLLELLQLLELMLL